MAPKKKGKGKKKDESKNQEKETTEWDNLDITSLNTAINEMRQQLETLQKRRNYTQIERNAVQDYHDVTQNQINEANVKIESLDREAERATNDHVVEIRVYTHKVRHLQYEHENELERVTQEREDAVADETERHASYVDDLKNAKVSLKEDRREKSLVYAEDIRKRELEYASKIEEAKETYRAELEDLKSQCDARLKEMEEDMELRRKLEIHDVEERKNLYIHDTVTKHKEAFERLKVYYKGIIGKNLNEIQSLRQELAERERRVGKIKEDIDKITSENKRLEEPLAVALTQMKKLSEETKNRDKDNISLQNTKARLSLSRKRLAELTAAHALLEKKYDRAVEERDALLLSSAATTTTTSKNGDDDDAAVNEAEEKSIDAFRESNAALERHLANLQRDNQVAECQLEDVVAAANMDVEEAKQIMAVFGDLLREKNRKIESLRLELATAKKRFEDCGVRCRESLLGLGVPLEDVLDVSGGE
mmetsp:Transcript_12890/g.16285  ORF Transcript_12890/g.16285 Transcript_12890/m.16285 type:complete len:480 (-) Transcript_12890:1050-2489(-)